MPPPGVLENRRFLRVAFISLAIVLAAAWLLGPVRYVEVLDRDSGEKYFAQPVQEGDLVRLSWVHSIEHTPWVEMYRVSNGQLALKESRIKSFGAGVDQVAPEVAHRNGWVILRGTERIFPALHLIYSREAAYDLRIAGRTLDLQERIPHHAAIRVGVKQSSRALWWFERDTRGG
ncbi:MAG: DUF1850 domain-containing protein [Rubrobacteraceae bacterium]